MSKKEITIDTITAAATQIVSIVTLTQPTTSLFAVTAVALAAGLSKEFLISRRENDLEQLAKDLCKTETIQAINKMNEEHFLDDLYYSTERILKQRNGSKRILMKRFFLGYIKAEHQESYSLEKMYKITENITFSDVEYLKRIFDALELKEKYPIPWVSKEIMENHNIPTSDQATMLILTHAKDSLETHSKLSLINEGLLVEHNRGIGMWDAGEGTPQIYTTPLGEYFRSYLMNSE